MNEWFGMKLNNLNKDTFSMAGKYVPYASIVVGSFIALLSGIYSAGIPFYVLSGLGLTIALLGQFASSYIEGSIRGFEEKELREQKLTPSRFNVGLKHKDSKNYLVLIQFQNLIPIEFKVAVLNDQDVFLSGIQLDWAKVYPAENNMNFNYAVSLNQNPPSIIKLEFTYQSVWAAESNNKELSGRIYQRYQVVPGGISFLGQSFQ